MRGVITLSDVLRHPWLVIAGFGVGCFLRCLLAAVSGKRCTFLAIAMEG